MFNKCMILVIIFSIMILSSSVNAENLVWKDTWIEGDLSTVNFCPDEAAALIDGGVYQGIWKERVSSKIIDSDGTSKSYFTYDRNPYVIVQCHWTYHISTGDTSPDFRNDKEEYYRVYESTGFYSPIKTQVVNFFIYENSKIAEKVFKNFVKEPHYLSELGFTYDNIKVRNQKENYVEVFRELLWDPRKSTEHTVLRGSRYEGILQLHSNIIVFTGSTARLTVERKGSNFGARKEEYLVLSDTNKLHNAAMAIAMPRALGKSVTLEYFEPLDHFKPGTGTNIAPAGDFIATVRDEDGNVLKDETVFFFIDKEVPENDEPGKNLFDVLAYEVAESDGPIGSLEVNPDLTKYMLNSGLDESLFSEDRIYIGKAVKTKVNGEAKISLLDHNLFDPQKFTKELIFQRAAFEDQGKISGVISAGVYDPKTKLFETESGYETNIYGIAKLLKITGEGRRDDSTSFCEAEDLRPPCPPLNRSFPGKIRVKRAIALPHFDYTEVYEGFLFMPGDILDIDGNAAVEIVWITGDKIIAQVPDKLGPFADMKIPQTNPHAEMILLSSAYDSGFYTGFEKVSSSVMGVTVGKGLETLVESLGPLGKAAKLTFDYYKEVQKSFEEIDFNNTPLTTKIRIRSTVIIDTTGEELKVYNIEGSPSVKTESGEVTLEDGESVSVSDEGTIDPVETFNGKEAEKKFYVNTGLTMPKKEGSGGIPNILMITIVIVGFIVLVVVMIFWIKKRKKH